MACFRMDLVNMDIIVNAIKEPASDPSVLDFRAIHPFQRGLVTLVFVVCAQFLVLSARGQTVSGAVSGTWVSPTGGPSLQTSIEVSGATVTFRHGSSLMDDGMGGQLDVGVKNAISFTGGTLSSVALNTMVPLAQMSIVNGITFNDSDASSVKLRMTLALTQPIGSAMVDVPLGLVSTDNTIDPVASADIVTLDSSAPVFRIGNRDYIVHLAWQTLDASKGFEAGQQFKTYEDKTSTLQLLGSFEAVPPTLAVGNGVFVDRNGNGHLDAGEGQVGVKVQLYRAGDTAGVTVPVAEAVSDLDGYYWMGGLEAGSYFLHLPADQFGPSGLLPGYFAATTNAAGDDQVGQNLLQSANPSATGLSTAVFTLAAGALPTATGGETGFQAFADDDDDANTDLTMDLGLSPPLGVGNVVFFDRNGNGHFDPGEGLSGVGVKLYDNGVTPGAGAPRAEVTSAANGAYLFDNLPPGSYFLHVPAGEFASAAVLDDMVSVSGTSTGADDEGGEDGQDAVNPSVSGVSTAAFVLAAGQSPTGSAEAGFAGASDDGRDADIDLTRDLGFVDATATPGTFAAWQTQNTLGGQNGASQNADHDTLSNLLEYALVDDPSSGIPGPCFCVTRNAATGDYDVTYRRRRGGAADLSYVVELHTSVTSNTGWTSPSQLPAVVNLGDGTESVTYASISDEPLFVGQPLGFARLRVDLDSNGDATPEDSAATTISGWERRALPVGHQSIGSTFTAPPVFSGLAGAFSAAAVDLSASAGSASISALFQSGKEYYLEVLDGALVGHRIEIDETASSGASIALIPAHELSTTQNVSSGLPGSRVVIRRHRTLSEAFPPAVHHATNRSSTADNVMVYQNASSAWKVYWLYAAPGGAYWTDSADAFLADKSSVVIGPAEGVFARPRTAPGSYETSGLVRTGSFAMPLKTGFNFIASPWPVSDSPASRVMTVANGFVSSSRVTNADRLLVWQGDDNPAQGNYATYAFFKIGADSWWSSASDVTLQDVGSQPLFGSGRAAFLQCKTAKPNWLLLSPAVD